MVREANQRWKRPLCANQSAADHANRIVLGRSGVPIIMLAGAVLACGMLFHPVDGHSYFLNISWHAGFLAELKAGSWYPRWISTTNQGLGAPSFYFYAPLPFYVSALLDIAWPFDHGPGFGPAAAAMAAIAASGMAMFALLRRLYGAPIALPVAIGFMAMPYHFGADFWWRAAFGEIWAFVWLPLIALGVLMQARKEPGGALLVGVSSAGMILSHLPSFVIGGFGAATASVVALAAAATGRLDRKAVLVILARSALAAAASLLVTAVYWYPALTTTHYTVMNEFMMQDWFDYRNNFIFSKNIHFDNWFIQWIAFFNLSIFILICALMILWCKHKDLNFIVPCAVFAMSIFMTTDHSAFIYALLSPLQRLQFPWRFLLLSEIALAAVIAHALSAIGVIHRDSISRRAGIIVAAAATTGLLGVSLLTPAVMRHAYHPGERERVETLLKNASDGSEYRTRVTDLDYYEDIRFGRREAPAGPRFADENRVAELSGVRSVPGRLIFKQFWYPDFAVRDQTTGRSLPTAPEPVTGLATAEIPAGPYDLVAERRTLKEVAIGQLVSAAGLIAALLWILAALLPRRRRRSAALRPSAS